jgi:hypothetical protein
MKAITLTEQLQHLLANANSNNKHLFETSSLEFGSEGGANNLPILQD